MVKQDPPSQRVWIEQVREMADDVGEVDELTVEGPFRYT
jgi:hypothetical protein